MREIYADTVNPSAAPSRYSSESLLISASIATLGIYLAWILLGPTGRGHDTIFAFGLLTAWQNAFNAGDWLPTWTPFHANGFGSPAPFFYHKLFYVVAGALSVLLSDTVAAMHLTIALFALLMLYGFMECAMRMGLDKRQAFILSVIAVLSPYALGNWFERYAVAEYSAMALIPLIIAQLLDIQQRKANRFTITKLFFLLLALAIAHSAIFPPVVFCILCYGSVLAIKERALGLRLISVTITSLALFVVLVYLPFSYLSAEFNLGQAAMYGPPDQHTVRWIDMMVSPSYPGHWFGWPVAALIICLVVSIRQRKHPFLRTAQILGSVALIQITLMSQTANAIWRLDDQLKFFQFPWRLLSVTVPLMFVALAGFLTGYNDSLRRKLLAAMLGVSISYGLLVTGALLYHRYTSHRMLSHEQLRNNPFSGGVEAGGEYCPAIYQRQFALKGQDLYVTSLLPPERPLVEVNDGCQVENPPLRKHFRELQIHVSCRSSGSVRINQFTSRFLKAQASNGESVIQPISGSLTIEFTLPSGEWDVTVAEQHYLALVKLSLESLFTHKEQPSS